ncbi:MAG TPA: hypothetical protein VF230_12465 [Acidimicrobiales bacterium]
MLRAEASAPIRVCDCGGWTDTWFAVQGVVVNLAVKPRAEVRVDVRLGGGGQGDGATVEIDAPGVDEAYAYPASDPPGRQPLLEQSVAVVDLPDDASVAVGIRCDAPAGASTGTSAAVVVALLGALDAVAAELAGRHRHEPRAIAALAHHVETARVGLQAGIQDQLASALGGVNVIRMDEYPHAQVAPVRMSAQTWRDLDRRLVVVYLGTSHVSSLVHGSVIAELDDEGPASPRLDALRACADDAVRALEANDLDAFGAVMRRNTEAQRALHPDLVGADATAVIELAAQLGATGWKVNGAGGEGGSVSILCADDGDAQQALEAAIDATAPWRRLPSRLDRVGLVVESTGLAADATKGWP